MTIANLSDVTQVLKTLLRTNLSRLGAPMFNVLAKSPTAYATTPAAGLEVAVHLYHVAEDPHHRNDPVPFGAGTTPVRHVPMALNLQYVVGVFAPQDANGDTNALNAQWVLGLVFKTLHDYPLLNNKTISPGSDDDLLFEGLALSGSDNRIELLVRPTSVEEAISFWGAEEKRTPVPAAFCEARVIMLPPEAPESATGIVLSLGQHIFTGGSPRLDHSESTLHFSLPIALPGFARRKLELTPARVALFAAGPLPADADYADNNRLRIVASGLSGGRRLLELVGPGELTVRVDLDQSVPENVPWAFRVASDLVEGSFHRQVFDTEGKGLVELVPGTYRARVLVETRKPTELGTFTHIRRASNEVAFSLTPQIIPLSAPVGGIHTLTVLGGFLAPTLKLDDDPLRVELSVGRVMLRDVRSLVKPAANGDVPLAPPLEDNTFLRTANGLTFRLAPGALDAEELPASIRLLVNGAEAPPRWILELGL